MQPSSYKTRSGKRLCDPTGWWMSEKLDGMKGRIVNGQLVTRSGKGLNPPKWFLKMLPRENGKILPVEGELYFGKGTFQQTGSLRSYDDGDWQNVKFHIFDIIDYKHRWIDRQNRLRLIHEEWKKKTEYPLNVKIVGWKKVKNSEHVEKYLKKVLSRGGEGLILANPKGKYEDGHVEQILKYKGCNDSEAVIVGYKTDKSGERLASFVVHPIEKGAVNKRMTFHIGTGLKIPQRYKFKQTHPLGTVITYTFEVVTKDGKPRTPIYKGIRTDLEFTE